MSDKNTGGSDEHEAGPWPVPGDPGVVFVIPKAGCGPQIIRIAFAIAPLFLCCGGTGAAVDYLFGRVFGEQEGAFGEFLFLVSIAIALAITAFMAWVLVVPIRAPYRHTILVLSPVGIEVQDNHFDVHTRLRWEDVTGCAKVSAPTEVPCAASPAQATIETDPRLPSDGHAVPLSLGIIGWAEQDLPEKLPQQWEEVIRVQRVDRINGKRQSAIPISFGGTNNPTNPLIRYMLHYCPQFFRGPPTRGGSAPAA